MQAKEIHNNDVNIRMYHEFVDRINNSVWRVTVWHHKALLSDAKLTEGQICLSLPQTHVGFFFIVYSWMPAFYLKIPCI